MTEPEPKRERYIPVWGIFLLFLGVVFLLQTFNVLPWGLWGKLWHFWPVLLIIAGINILLRRYNLWLVGALILALLFACLGVAVWQYEPSIPPGEIAKSYSVPTGSLDSARIQIDFNGGSLTIGSLFASSINLVEATSRTANGDMRAAFHEQDGKGSLSLSTDRAGRQFWDKTEAKWEVRFNRNIPLNIDIKAAASDSHLALRELKVSELQMDVDAGNYIVALPSPSGTTHIYIKSDVANLEITIPQGVAARFKIDSDLSATEIDEKRFPPREEGYYISPNFESAENRIDLELDCDVGRVQVR